MTTYNPYYPAISVECYEAEFEQMATAQVRHELKAASREMHSANQRFGANARRAFDNALSRWFAATNVMCRREPAVI
jgi:hypothetical protein